MMRVGLHWASLKPGLRWECAGTCRPDADGHIDESRARKRNCHGRTNPRFMSPIAGRLMDFDERSATDQCPNRFVTTEAAGYIHLWALGRDRGCLPSSGGLLDQDHRTVEAIGILDAESTRIRESLMAQARA